MMFELMKFRFIPRRDRLKRSVLFRRYGGLVYVGLPRAKNYIRSRYDYDFGFWSSNVSLLYRKNGKVKIYREEMK